MESPSEESVVERPPVTAEGVAEKAQVLWERAAGDAKTFKKEAQEAEMQRDYGRKAGANMQAYAAEHAAAFLDLAGKSAGEKKTFGRGYVNKTEILSFRVEPADFVPDDTGTSELSKRIRQRQMQIPENPEEYSGSAAVVAQMVPYFYKNMSLGQDALYRLDNLKKPEQKVRVGTALENLSLDFERKKTTDDAGHSKEFVSVSIVVDFLEDVNRK